MENNKPAKKFPVKIVALIAGILILAAAATAIFFIFFWDKENTEIDIDNNLEDVRKPANDNGISVMSADKNAGKLEIIPTRSTSMGIEINTEFIIRTDASMNIASVAQLKNCIEIISQLKGDISEKIGEIFGYELRETDTEYEYIMSFDLPLKYDALYRIEFTTGENNPVSFAFQTVESFKVTSSTPGSEAYSVPVNSGIEITFNEKIEGDFKDYFTISPFVNGKFENIGNTYIFIPDSLIQNTRYDITVRKGLASSESEKILEEDYNMFFWTQWSGNVADSVNIYGDAYETFLSDDEVFVELSAKGAFLEKSYNVEIYQADHEISPEEYLNAQNILRDTPEYLSGLNLLDNFDTELLNIENNIQTSYSYISNSYIMLDKTLPDGFYIIKITTNHDNKTYELYKFIQVSPLSVYSATFDGEMLFWVNDALLGLPASGAKISIAGHETAVTDGEGLAVIKTTVDETAYVTINYEDFPAFIYKTISRKPVELTLPSRYYHYIYTDRKAYRPNDTIDVFGVVQERYDEYKITADDKISLKIGNMIEIPVSLDKYGSFNVKIPIRDLAGYLVLDLYFNNEVLTSSYFNVVDYDNAKYIIESESDKNTYRPGETAEITMTAETYDGVLVEGLEIMRSGTILGITGGETPTVLREPLYANQWNYGWSPYTNSFYYNIGKTENGIQYVSVPFVFMPSDIMLEYEAAADKSGDISFSSNFIDRDVIESYVNESWYNAYSLEPDIYRGAPADINFTLEILRTESIRVKTGERYDYINKINVPVYEYKTEQYTEETRELRTTNGKASVSGLPLSYAADDDVYISYRAIVRYNDSDGNPIEISVYYANSYNWNSGIESNIKHYYFDMYNSDGENTYSLKLNETGYVKLQEWNQSDITEGKILTVPFKNKILDKQVGSPTGTPLTFKEDYIYNVRIAGAYFNGRYIYPIYGMSVYYDYTEKALDFDVSFDKDYYEPGDNVSAEIKVTDKDGNPKKTLVNISVVDESVFAEYDNNANMPAYYYNSVVYYNGNYSYYASYTQHEFSNGDGGAEMGGGGGDDYTVRKDFTDNPAFMSVETDENGVAVIDFKLAEKLTSWRVTVHGVTEDYYVGNNKNNIISTMDFAVDLVMNNEYIEGDEIYITVKPQGMQYKYNQTEVLYNIEILKDSSIVFSDTGTSVKNMFMFNAGKLPEGNYTVRVTAEASSDIGGLRDGIEKEFEVIKSGVLLALNAKEIISEETPVLKDFEIKTSPVTVTMSNYDMAFIMNTLYSGMSYNSKRTDYMAANVFARKFIESVYNKTPLNISPTDYSYAGINSFAGMSELIYGGSDILYMARFYACFPETIQASAFDKNAIRNYIYDECYLYNGNIKSLKNMTPEFENNEYLELTRAAGYLTLASIGDAVLIDIYEQINIINNSANQDKFTQSYQSYMRVLYYAAALCVLGDDYKAAQLIEAYKDFVGFDGKTQSAETEEMCKESIDTLMLYINTRLDQEAAYKYLKEKQTNKYISDIGEKMNFVRYFNIKGGTRSEIEYTLDGVTKKAVFENYDILELALTKEQFEDLNIKYISGNTSVSLSFNGSPDNLDDDKNSIYLSKQILSREEYRMLGNSVDDIDESTYYIMLTLKFNSATSGYYTIRDRLPGNMRYLNNTDYTYVNNCYISNPEKQFVDVRVYMQNADEVTIVYNAVKISDSEAVAEKAYVSQDFKIDEIWGVSQ